MSRVEQVFSVEYLQTLRWMFGFFEPREMLKSFEARGMSGSTSRIVSYAREFTWVYIYDTHRGMDLIPPCLNLPESVVIGLLSLSGVCVVIFGGSVMCYPGRR